MPRRLAAMGAATLVGLALVLVPALPAASQDAPDYLSWANPGPYMSPNPADFAITSFGSQQPIVTTYFFYWFDATYMQSLPQPEQFLFNPVDADTESFFDPSWYYKQFSDMLDAGIDVVLPDYWGEPGQVDRRVAPAPDRNLFATQGLAPMTQALERLDSEGRPLKVALFLDTSMLNNEDLTTDRGKQIFYATIRDYFSRIPPRYWAAIDGRPIVWLYDAQRVDAFDQSTFDYVYQQFPQDFGGLSPWIVREWQWYSAKNAASSAVIQTDGLYNWGAAPSGFNPDGRFTVAEVGPGFQSDEEGAPVVPRQEGAYYTQNLQAALSSGRKILAIETWNELDEGSAILETREFGRQYIDLTRRFADSFKGIQ